MGAWCDCRWASARPRSIAVIEAAGYPATLEGAQVMTNFAELRVFLCTTPTSMSFCFDRLMGIAERIFNQDPLSGTLFLFVGPAKFLAGFQGYLHADAYVGYDHIYLGSNDATLEVALSRTLHQPTILECCNSAIASAATRKQAAWWEFSRPLSSLETAQELTQQSHRPRALSGSFCQKMRLCWRMILRATPVLALGTTARAKSFARTSRLGGVNPLVLSSNASPVGPKLLSGHS